METLSARVVDHLLAVLRAGVSPTHAIEAFDELVALIGTGDGARGPIAIADVTGLVAALAAKQAAGDYAPAGSYADAAHGHALADVIGLVAALAALDAAVAGKQDAGSYAPLSHSHILADVTGLVAALAALDAAIAGKQDAGSYAAAVHSHVLADVTGLVAALAGKQDAGSYQPSDADLTLIASLTTTAYGRAFLELTNQAALTALLAAATASLPGAMSAQDKTRLDALHSVYRTILEASGSHIAAKVAGTYGLGHGDPLAVSGTGTLYPLAVMYIDPADYPAVGTLAAKLRIRAQLACNDVAPTGNFTVGLHPVTRPATSGGAGLGIYTIAAAVAGSTAVVNTPAADSHNNMVGNDFAVPAAGFYVIAVVTTGTVATSAHVHLSAQLQLRYS